MQLIFFVLVILCVFNYKFSYGATHLAEETVSYCDSSNKYLYHANARYFPKNKGILSQFISIKDKRIKNKIYNI